MANRRPALDRFFVLGSHTGEKGLPWTLLLVTLRLRATERGKVLEETQIAPFVVATVHPSSILRAPDSAARHEAEREFIADLAVAASLL